MRRTRAAVLVAAALLLPGERVVAHEETALHALAVIDRVDPHVPGISFRVTQLTQPVLVAENRTDEPLVVLGPDGEPFLRLWRNRIDTNVNSTLTYLSRDPSGDHATVPEGIDPTARPLWRSLEDGRSWSWFDPRVRRRPSGPDRWKIEARAGTTDISIEGSFESLDGHGHFVTRLEDESTTVDGLEIKLIDGPVPAIFVRNDTGSVLRVEGRHGEPFLEIGPDGVIGNSLSPDYYLGGTQTVRDVPARADPSAEPVWRKLSDVPIWSWLEFRARLPAAAHERSRLGNEPGPVLRWTTPMVLGDRPLPLSGVVEWRPPSSALDRERAPTEESGFRSTLLAGAAAVALAAAAAFLARRRRDRKPG